MAGHGWSGSNDAGADAGAALGQNFARVLWTAWQVSSRRSGAPSVLAWSMFWPRLLQAFHWNDAISSEDGEALPLLLGMKLVRLRAARECDGQFPAAALS